jgi:hypothetical protein
MSSSALKTIKNIESSEYFSAVFVISFNHPSAICHIQNYISLLLSLSLLVSLQNVSIIESFLRAKELKSSSPCYDLVKQRIDVLFLKCSRFKLSKVLKIRKK